MTEFTVNAVLDAVAAVVPDRLMTICGSRRSTFAESVERISSLAGFLTAQGVRPDYEAAGLNRWECGQDPLDRWVFACARSASVWFFRYPKLI